MMCPCRIHYHAFVNSVSTLIRTPSHLLLLPSALLLWIIVPEDQHAVSTEHRCRCWWELANRNGAFFPLGFHFAAGYVFKNSFRWKESCKKHCSGPERRTTEVEAVNLEGNRWKEKKKKKEIEKSSSIPTLS